MTAGESAAGARIELDALTKRYPGQADPAVDGISLDIPAGEIVVLVGPSGCGKTTVLKMINRLIEPTSGRIVLDGEDVTRTNADHLRRHIGYVIQQVGLFPHLTVAQNVGMVPGLLGWDRARIAARVDELLALVGLDPDGYRGRYPKELSGGQGQRVGVARAMAGDPPVLLMDEPFGAIDPITHDRLQNELLRIQSEMGRTIVFVTHDIDEAIKLGDRIAILTGRSHVEQYDTPETILSAPANRFVAEFIGSGAVLKRLDLTRVGDIGLHEGPVAPADEDPASLRDRVAAHAGGPVLLVDGERRPLRWVTPGDDAGRPPAIVAADATLRDALDALVGSTVGRVVVTDGRGRYEGVVDLGTVITAVDGMRRGAGDARAAGSGEPARAAGSGEPARAAGGGEPDPMAAGD